MSGILNVFVVYNQNVVIIKKLLSIHLLL